MSKRVPQLLVAMVALFGLLAIGLALRPDHRGSSTEASGAPNGPNSTSVTTLSPTEKAVNASRDFLDRYVEGDGRVRRDPDGDTVSEGQAYAMLLAVAIGDDTRFGLVWNWARTNMLATNGSLSWHWVNGAIVDRNAATDADIDAARALLLAADRFSVPAYRVDGLSLESALLQQEVVQPSSGPVVVAGPWATALPYTINPSYLSPVAFDLFAEASSDGRWTQVRTAGTALLSTVTDGGRSLPPDWAVVDGNGTPTPSTAPGGAAMAYSYDAFRTIPRLAEACDAPSRELAAALWAPASRAIDSRAATANLDGSAQTSGDNPLFLIAAAASARAAGQTTKVDSLLDRRNRPTTAHRRTT